MDESTRIWRDRVARWHKSGQSARVFAEQEGVNAGTLYSWSRRLGMKRSAYRQSAEKATLPTLLYVTPSSISWSSSRYATSIASPPRPGPHSRRPPLARFASGSPRTHAHLAGNAGAPPPSCASWHATVSAP
ncbi:IS66 family insertion sequence element accessory protein TnpA [Sorangium sp. So ce185]|uniref:IS66 family insertion sequence element accessory protein TnpA n=1 Tax=Sorangium sp. So ce185 TaxID=3133287 RepID=UPI003F642D1A